MKILSPRVHGYLDYAVVLFLALSPALFGLVGTPAALCYVLSVLHFGMTIMTAAPLGAVKALPFTAHGAIEFGMAMFLAVAPWLFGFSLIAPARNYFVATAIVTGALWMTTTYELAREELGARRYGRQSFT